MQAPQARLHPCRAGIRARIHRLLQCYHTVQALKDYRLYCINRGGKVLIFASTTTPPSTIHEPYIHGIQIALSTGERGEINPSLGLLSILQVEKTLPRKHYVVVNSQAAQLFLYGRDVFSSSILELQLDTKCKRYPMVVMSPEKDLLGYGKPVRRNGELLIRNILDAGWYLRSGV